MRHSAKSGELGRHADFETEGRRCRVVDGQVGRQTETLGVYRIDPAAKADEQIQHVNADWAHCASGRLVKVGASVSIPVTQARVVGKVCVCMDYFSNIAALDAAFHFQ